MDAAAQSSIFVAAKPFIVGGTSGCMATCIIQPIDMVKVQLQLVGEGGKKGVASKNPVNVAYALIQKNGFTSLYKGLDAGVMRQVFYTTARTGLFRVFSDAMTEYVPSSSDSTELIKLPLPLYKKGLAGLMSGALGSLIGNPCDLALIRMQADNTLPVSQRRNYTSIFNAISRISKEEGILSLWRGSTPTVLRAMMLNSAMFAASDQMKEYLVPRMGNTLSTSLITSAFAGLCAATVSIPFDFVKTRMQKMKPDPQTNKYPYKNVFDCAYKIMRSEGIGAFYSGYVVYCLRVGQHAMLTLFFIDMINKSF